MYTDGITAALNTRSELFSEQRLTASLSQNGQVSAADLRQRIIASVERFVGNVPQSDDMTLLILRRQ
jgi:sigma-B regulation protein RsbU (phosphoserine phosphatase)